MKKLNKKEKYYAIVFSEGPESDNDFYMATDKVLKKASIKYKGSLKEFNKDPGGFDGSKPELLLVKIERTEKITILKAAELKKINRIRNLR